MTKKFFSTLALFLFSIAGFSQVKDSIVINSIFDSAFTSHTAYGQLRFLTKNIGPRLAGSEASGRAIQWAKDQMTNMKLDSVYLQPCMVWHWERGNPEKGVIRSKTLGSREIHLLSLGGSIGTPESGTRASVIEVDSLSVLKKLGKEKIQGNIVFYNRPMNPMFYRVGRAYGGAVDQRTRGAMEAGKYGAAAVIVRSMTLAHDDYPHTGIMRYDTIIPKIPALAISTNDADLLSLWLKKDPNLVVSVLSNSKRLEDVPSANVIGEIRGSKYPDEIIVVGGHLDSWDNTEGAHDDGAGCIHSLEALRLLQSIGYKPQHTIRVVMFIDEETYQRGGRKYAEIAGKKSEKHVAAIETDSGGFSPSGFGMDASDQQFAKFKNWEPLFKPYGVHEFSKGGGGVDISFMKDLKIPLIGLSVDSQRYFDLHHSAKDVFETVNERELQSGSAYIAALIYLLDKYGL